LEGLVYLSTAEGTDELKWTASDGVMSSTDATVTIYVNAGDGTDTDTPVDTDSSESGLIKALLGVLLLGLTL